MAETLIAGRYRLDELLGRGGMSEVWAATDLELDRRVALKLLAPNEDNARFEREARAVAALGHPNVTQLYDYGESDGRPFMVLEYLAGGSLEELLRASGALADADTHRIASEIAAGLAHAHARGVVHRDLKPSNVLFDEVGRAKLADFGIARMAVGEGTLTEAGTVLGTAAYISPEQAAGLPATPASDVYSFGVLLFRMLTGTLPFVSEDPLALVVAHRDEPPPLVTELRPDAPPALAATADAALAKDPSTRPADGAMLLDGLVGSGLALAADTEVTRVMPGVRPPRRRSPFGRAVVVALRGLHRRRRVRRRRPRSSRRRRSPRPLSRRPPPIRPRPSPRRRRRARASSSASCRSSRAAWSSWPAAQRWSSASAWRSSSSSSPTASSASRPGQPPP